MRRPKVCILQYNSNFFLTRVDRAARALAEAGYEVVLLGIKDDRTDLFEQREGYVVKRVELKSRRLPGRFGLRALRFIEALAKTFMTAYRENADVYNSRDLPPAFVTNLAARLRRAKWVYDGDELNLDRNWAWSEKPLVPKLIKFYEGHYIRKADAVITSDIGRADILERVYQIPRPTVVLNVPEIVEKLEPDLTFREQALKGKRYLLIYLGGFVANRSLPEQIRAMRKLGDCALALVGFGYLRDELAAQIEREKMGDQVTIFDPVPFDRMMRYTAAADIGMLTFVGSCLSYAYGAPNKQFEYMMAAIPIVCSDLPDMADIVREQRTGQLVIDPTDPVQIADAVRALIDGPEPLAEIGARARKVALDRYNWNKEKKVQVQVFDDLGLKTPSQLVRGTKRVETT